MAVVAGAELGTRRPGRTCWLCVGDMQVPGQQMAMGTEDPGSRRRGLWAVGSDYVVEHMLMLPA